jgi:hypothetical protein
MDKNISFKNAEYVILCNLIQLLLDAGESYFNIRSLALENISDPQERTRLRLVLDKIANELITDKHFLKDEIAASEYYAISDGEKPTYSGNWSFL